MNKFFIFVAAVLMFSCSSMQLTNRSLASEEMQDAVLDETVQDDISNKTVNCDLAVKANAITNKKQRLDLLVKEAAYIDNQAKVILNNSANVKSICAESKWLLAEALKLSDRALCFKSAVSKYYDVKAVKSGAAYAKAVAAYDKKMADAHKIYVFNLPLSTKNCDLADYLKPFNEGPLSEVIPLINAK